MKRVPSDLSQPTNQTLASTFRESTALFSCLPTGQSLILDFHTDSLPYPSGN